jgi:proteic killer suppression protein
MRLPTYRFHALKGDRKGDYAVSIRANWRITFAWQDGDAVRVDMEDYHGR